MSIVRALTVNYGLFRADNNVRRLVKDFALNYQIASNSVTEFTCELLPGSSQIFNAEGSTVTILRCSSPVQLNYTLKAGNNRPSDVLVSSMVTSMIHLDDNVGNVSIVNVSLTPSTIYFVQG